MVKKYILTWDLGATKCCAGVVEYDTQTNDLKCINQCKVKLRDATSLEDLINKIENALDFSHQTVDCICIAGAGCYDGEYLAHENTYPYPMHFAKIARDNNWPRYDVIHDYAPIVCATFTNYMDQPNNLKRLNTNELKHHGRRVALGIGTGLGMKDGVLFENGDFWLGQNEVGHTGIAHPPAADQYHKHLHTELMHYLHQREPNNSVITFEKILTGSGTVNLYQFFYPDAEETTPEAVGVKMREGKANEMVNAFSWYIGLFVGLVQLTFMPDGGVWITGGVALSHLDVFDRPEFRIGISASPAYWSQREQFPLGVLCNQEHALIGCGYYAVKRLMSHSDEIKKLSRYKAVV